MADLFIIFIEFNKIFAPFFQAVTARKIKFNVRVCQSNRVKVLLPKHPNPKVFSNSK